MNRSRTSKTGKESLILMKPYVTNSWYVDRIERKGFSRNAALRNHSSWRTQKTVRIL